MKHFTCLMLLFALPQLAMARVDISVTPREIALGQSVIVILTSTKSAPKLDAIDLTPLVGDFVVMDRAYAGSDSTSGPAQTLELRLTPLNTGLLLIPPLRIGQARTATQSITVHVGTAEFPAVRIASGFVEARLYERGEATLYLDTYDDGTLQWRAPVLHARDFVLRPLPTQQHDVVIDQRSVRLTRWRWGALPLQPVPAAVQFDLIEATRFGERLAFRAPAAVAQVHSVPGYLPVSLHIGHLELLGSHVGPRLRVGRPALRETLLRGRGLSTTALRKMIRFPLSDDSIHYYRPEMTLEALPDGTQRVRIREAFKPLHEGELRLTGFTVPYLDPTRSAIRNLSVDSQVISALSPSLRAARILAALLALAVVLGMAVWLNRAKLAAWRRQHVLRTAIRNAASPRDALRVIYANPSVIALLVENGQLARLEKLVYASANGADNEFFKLRGDLVRALRKPRQPRPSLRPHQIVFRPHTPKARGVLRRESNLRIAQNSSI